MERHYIICVFVYLFPRHFGTAQRNGSRFSSCAQHVKCQVLTSQKFNSGAPENFKGPKTNFLHRLPRASRIMIIFSGKGFKQFLRGANFQGRKKINPRDCGKLCLFIIIDYEFSLYYIGIINLLVAINHFAERNLIF